MSQSYIDATITKMISSKRGNEGVIANLIQNVDHDLPATRIGIKFEELKAQRNAMLNAKRIAEQSGEAIAIPEEPPAKPENLLSFVQSLMNNICWAHRKALQAVTSAEREEQAWGLDFSQDIAEQVGIEDNRATEALALQIDDDYATLNALHTWLGSGMSYLSDIKPLYYFHQSELQPALDANGKPIGTVEVYVDTITATDIDEAMNAMNDIVSKLQDEAPEKAIAAAAAMDFSAASLPVRRPDIVAKLNADEEAA
jgi:hypothetical protein